MPVLITTTTNLDYLIPGLSYAYGDYDGTLYSEAVYRTGLVNAVRYLERRWNKKYQLDSSNNIERNTSYAFDTTSPPIIEQQDEQAIILAAVLLMRQAKITSSADTFTSWSTPDLSVSAGGTSKAYVDLWKSAQSDLETWFRHHLGVSKKRFFYSTDGGYPVSSG